MNGTLLKMSFFEKIGTFFDIIPKVIYFLATTFLSAIDLLQHLVRKLAGLDVYYVKEGFDNLTAVTQQDPLTEFIYGILGYGDSAPLYKGLNTVFLSLIVFAIICLAVTTIIAIVKSHYGEDANATSPWKYIYTAIKAVLTFAIIPFTVVIGLKLASWALRTLDSITAGSATEESLKSTMGSNADQIFIASNIDGSEVKYYTHYDYFGAGGATTSTPFSGMLFKACAYEANRARKDETFANHVYDIDNKDGQKVFERVEGVSTADQVDYAFANHLNLKGAIWGGELQLKLKTVAYWSVTDLINALPTVCDHFTKFNVGMVWMFYNLWSYNAIVAFGGGVSIFGIMLSVIIGLMSRLAKGAILFLIYPSLLGIAPLDNFKAFKSWTTQFIQQIMMAFGAIVGMNLTLLILPYLQNIRFFGIGVVDNLVNTIIVITALMMMKDIISMISNFAGGADANAVGGGLKGEVGKAFAKGATTAGILGVGTALFAGGTAGTARKKLHQWFGPASRKLRREMGGSSTMKGNAATSGGLANSIRTKAQTLKGSFQSEQQAMLNQLYGSAGYQNANDEQKKDMEKSARKKFAEEFSKNHASDLGSLKADSTKFAEDRKRYKTRTGKTLYIDQNGKLQDGDQRKRELQNEDGLWKAFTRPGRKLTRAVSAKLLGYQTNKDGSVKTVHGVAQLNAPTFKAFMSQAWDKSLGAATMALAGKHLADGFLKSLNQVSAGAGLDKMLGGMTDIFKQGVKFEGGIFDNKSKLEGDKLAEKHHAETQARMATDAKAAADRHDELLKALRNSNSSDAVVKAIEKMNLATTNKLDQIGRTFSAGNKNNNNAGGTNP
ncbi:MAG: hypothetical protein J6A28_04200 [Clostridia bacterium]|nr:hypothetical protein [Clostridia bacterium]